MVSSGQVARYAGPSRVPAALLIAAAAFALFGCEDVPGGSNTTKAATQTADDGEGSPVTTKYPDSYALDGPAFAVSNPVAWQQMFTMTEAHRGPKAKNLPSATAKGVATSFFEVKRKWPFAPERLDLDVVTNLHPNIVSGKSTLVLTITVTGQGGSGFSTDRDYTYEIEPDPTVPDTVDIKLNGNQVGSVRNNSDYRDVRPTHLTLPNGSYKFEFEWSVGTTADGGADLTANSYLDFK